MFTVILGLLLLIQFHGNCVSELVIWSKVCGADEFTYTRSLDHEWFYTNGNRVEKVSFCKSFEFYYRNGCFLDLGLEECERLGRSYCGLEIYSVQLTQRGGRRSLREFGTDQSTHRIEKNHVPSSWVAPNNIAMIASGILLLYCSFLCAGCRSKTKETTKIAHKGPDSS